MLHDVIPADHVALVTYRICQGDLHLEHATFIGPRVKSTGVMGSVQNGFQLVIPLVGSG